jgi:hypothetical protein
VTRGYATNLIRSIARTGVVGTLAAFVVAASACSNPSPTIDTLTERRQTLNEAFSLGSIDPARAAELFAMAGPGAEIERTRLVAWADCLVRSQASAESWRRFLSGDPPADLAARARIALARLLIEKGDFEEVLVEHSLLPVELQPKVDELLLDVDDQNLRLQGANRLAVTAPQRLRAADRELERDVLPSLSSEERIARSRAWRRAGAPTRAAAELRSLRWRGEVERLRRQELARAELDAGSPRRALSVLPAARNSNAEELRLRAESHRNRAWQIYPDGQSRKAFLDCLAAAKMAVAAAIDHDLLVTSLRLGLECSSEGGQLETALEYWRVLEASKWDDPRREWLGRRLGVALARNAETRSATSEIASYLPNHQRCLRFWGGGAGESDRQELEDLAAASPADLYGLWARQALDRPGPHTLDLKPPLEIGEAPPPVQQLLEMGAEEEAVREWRHIRRLRGSSPEEALAASELAARRGLPNEMIRWLRVGFPELGTVEMAAVPANAVRSYLPLRWQSALIAAAREAGVDPWLVAAVARQESTFSAHARSPRGAIGVLQLVPRTAREQARVLGMDRSPDLQNPEVNLRLGAHELARLRRRFGALEPALAAYNAGESRVRKWWRRWPEPHRFTEEVPIPETYNYVRRVMFLSESYRLVHEDIWGSSP